MKTTEEAFKNEEDLFYKSFESNFNGKDGTVEKQREVSHSMSQINRRNVKPIRRE